MNKCFILTLLLCRSISVYTQEKLIVAPGSFSYSTLYSFNLQTCYKVNNEGEQRIKHIVKYRSDGQKDYEINNILSDSFKIQYYYNEANQLLKVERLSCTSGHVTYRKDNFYDYNNQLMRTELNLNSDSIIDEKVYFEYDLKGNNIKETKVTGSFRIHKTTIHRVFDDRRNLIKESIYQNNDTIAEKITEKKYDALNHIFYLKVSENNGTCTLSTTTKKGNLKIKSNQYYRNFESFPYFEYRETIDARGIIVLEENLNSTMKNGKLSTSIKFNKRVYDEKGKVPIDLSVDDRYSMGNYFFYYDSKGRKVKEYGDENNLLSSTPLMFLYRDSADCEIKSKYAADSKILLEKHIYQYDKLGNLLSYRHFYRNADKPSHKVINKYDSLSNLILAKVYEKDSILKFTDSFIYDNAGHKLRHFFISKNSIINFLTAYDENGNTTIADGRFYEFENFRRFPALGKGLAHVLKVEIPSSGTWEFNIANANFNNVIAIGDAINENNYKKMMTSNSVKYDNQLMLELNQGVYYFFIAGVDSNDAGVYKLDINRKN